MSRLQRRSTRGEKKPPSPHQPPETGGNQRGKGIQSPEGSWSRVPAWCSVPAVRGPHVGPPQLRRAAPAPGLHVASDLWFGKRMAISALPLGHVPWPSFWLFEFASSASLNFPVYITSPPRTLLSSHLTFVKSFYLQRHSRKLRETGEEGEKKRSWSHGASCITLRQPAGTKVRDFPWYEMHSLLNEIFLIC